MRLLLSFILSSFFFLAGTAGENAAPYTIDSNVTAKEQRTKISFVDCLQNSRFGTALYVKAGRKTANQSNHYSHFFTAAKSAAFSLVAREKDLAVLSATYSFCTPIGRKLLFPKHYFW